MSGSHKTDDLVNDMLAIQRQTGDDPTLMKASSK
jgi:hypothetical protein